MNKINAFSLVGFIVGLSAVLVAIVGVVFSVIGFINSKSN